MMGSFCKVEEDLFFESREEITSVSDSGSDCAEAENVDSRSRFVDLVSSNFQYEVWIKDPGSVHDRRNKFLKLMGLSLDRTVRQSSENSDSDEIEVEIDRITESSGAVLRYQEDFSINEIEGEIDRITENTGVNPRDSGIEDEFSSSRSSMSCWSNEDPDVSGYGASEENLICRIKNLDDGTEFIVHELGQDGMLSRLREVGSNRLVTFEEFHRALGLSPLFEELMDREVAEVHHIPKTSKRVKKGWLRRLGIMACIVDRQEEAGNLRTSCSNPAMGDCARRVRVHSYKKRSKEFSGLYMGQEMQAHEGSILTMKFSLDGQYLATAGDDTVVRVWQVVENERSNKHNILDVDPSCFYFTLNHSSELSPLFAQKEKKSLRKSSNSACVIIPPNILGISEKPMHEYHGHNGEVLDLSWSRNKYLLSSSVDKTVRLWQVGCDECLKVFSHNNYVTCVQFNPVDDNYFISGSIDGKVRIWAIPGCRVVDWTDIKEIVTAVCYRPDGQGGIVGSMTGNCRFYDSSENHLRLDEQLCVQGKKKYPCRRITGFQFSPSDPSKLMVTSADSQVRILHGYDVICKYRGIRNTGSQISASFTSDGKHIVSASEDSNVFVWNYQNQDGPSPSKMKNIWSCEHFFSSNVSVAIPWCGLNSTMPGICLSSQTPRNPPGTCPENRSQHCQFEDNLCPTIPLCSPDQFCLRHNFFSEALPRGTATWPEDKLPTSTRVVLSSPICKSQYKFLKTACDSTISSPHAWGLVIVTAGWDGRLRLFHNYGLPIRR